MYAAPAGGGAYGCSGADEDSSCSRSSRSWRRVSGGCDSGSGSGCCGGSCTGGETREGSSKRGALRTGSWSGGPSNCGSSKFGAGRERRAAIPDSELRSGGSVRPGRLAQSGMSTGAGGVGADGTDGVAGGGALACDSAGAVSLVQPWPSHRRTRDGSAGSGYHPAGTFEGPSSTAT
jgi:hypothetical protein